MTDRLSSLDVSFLYLEQPTTAMHVGSVMIFRPPAEGLDVSRLIRHVGSRIAFVPRYRQRIRSVPGRIANPVWVETSTSTSAITSGRPPCPGRAAMPSWRNWSRGCRPARWTGAVRSGELYLVEA